MLRLQELSVVAILSGLNFLRTLGFRDSESSKQEQRLMEQELKAEATWQNYLLLMWSLFQFLFRAAVGRPRQGVAQEGMNKWFEVSGHIRNYDSLIGLNFLKVLGFRDSESSKQKQRLIEQELQAPAACAELLATVAQVICFTLLSKWAPPKIPFKYVPLSPTKSHLIVASLCG